jgi:hypothetical protein
MKKPILLPLFLSFVFLAHAQMWNGADTLYGNEWIDFSKTYLKIKIAEDGIYRLDFQTLASAGIPVGSLPASQFRLYRYGQQVPVFTSTDGIFGSGDYLEFYGEKNRDAVDKFLFGNAGEENINRWYSLFNDTTAYFFTWETTGQPLRFSALPNDLNNLPPKSEFCWFTAEQVYFQSFVKRKRSDEVTFSWFEGEGFCRALSTQTAVSLVPKKLYAAGPAASVTVRYACEAGGGHMQRITVNDTLFAEDAFADWKVVERTFDVPLSLILNNALVKIQSALGGNDRHAAAGFFLRYPHQFDFENANYAAFSLDASSEAQYLEIQAFNTSAGSPILFDLTNKIRLETTLEGGLIKAKVPPSASERQLILLSPSAVKTVGQLQAVQFRDYRSEQADYVIISNPVLFDDEGTNHVAEFAAYRESAAGGGHKVTIVDVNELYEQFAYGVRFHPIAVRNFLHYAEKNWPNLNFAFIIGKGLDYKDFRTSTAQNSLADSLFFVPTYGSPAADMPFVLTGNRLSKPLAALGRLAVTKPSDIGVYLEKVKSHELTQQTATQTIEGKAWMKRVIHNSGGLAGESGAIKVYTSDMANVLSNNRFGADVHTFYKTSNDPIQLSSFEQMLDLINGGVSLWTIYGHSSAFAVDFDIGSPGNYNNTSRYPLLMVMGCFSGLCSSSQQGIGEQFVLAPDRGAIAYIASVHYSFINALHDYGRKYYELLGGEYYGKSVGEVLQATVGELQDEDNNGLVALLHQNLLQGDPAVKIQANPGPDYLIDNQSVKFNPNPIGLEENTFKLNFDLANIGENTGGQVAVKVEQRLPDNTILSRITDTVEASPFRRSLEYSLPVAGSKIGFNRFFITVDPENQVNEKPFAAELNNELTDATGERGVDVYFYSDDVQAVAPPPYSIVRNSEITLRASTLNTNAAPLRYLFEIDTLETFGSPFKKSAQVFQRGGLLEWKPPISLKDSAVYYWRVARDSLVNGAVVWRTRSFIYLPNSSTGWNQSDFGQYRDGIFANMEAVDSTRRLEFLNNASNILLSVAYRGVNRYPGIQNLYYDNFLGDYGFNIRNVDDGVVMVLADPNTGHFVPNPEQGLNTVDPPERRFIHWFNTRDSLERVKLMQFIENQIPNGYYAALLAFSRPWDSVGYSPRKWAKDSVSFGKNIFSVLENQGAKKVRQLPNYTTSPWPYGILFRKNDPSWPVQDTIVFNPDSAALLRGNFLAKWTNGLLETPVIGPAKSWKSIHWKRQTFDDPSDYAHLTLLGVRDGEDDVPLLKLAGTFDTALDFVSAAQFPQLKIRYAAGDTLTRSLTQLDYLRVLYEGLPEGALHPVAKYEFYRDTLQQGENLKTSIAFFNVSDAAFDSLLVKFRVEGATGGGTNFLKKYEPLAAGDTLLANFETNTLSLGGSQRLLIDVNPENDQPELYHFNNVAVQDFFVSRDNRSPLLEVTFDGVHILDGDLISPKPEIVITLKDDNRFLAMTDTATFRLRLESPDGSSQPISFSDPSLLFIPADASDLPKKNLARLEWRPVFTQDGDYRLLVNGRDASGNESASLDYSVTFKVITKSSISNILNYPNPFSTRTCFVYTMTGAETPTHFKIQIMTVSGRVVREITEAEFGALRAGTHQSDFCWDGKDEYGDQLANGVYLYRIVAKKADGSDFEFFDNDSVDGYFKGGFGKMVLLR